MVKNSKHLGRWLAIAVAIGLCCSAEALAVKPPPAEEPLTYTLVELSSTPGAVRALNQLDGFVELAGCLYDDLGDIQVPRAHYWMVGTGDEVLLSIDLQTLPEEPGAMGLSWALDINNQGVVVGYQDGGPDGPRRPLLWPDAAALPIELPLPEETVGAMAVSINDAGIVLGCTYNSAGRANLVAWKVEAVAGEWAVQDILTISAPGVYSVSALPQIVNSGYVSATLEVLVDPEDPEAIESRAFRLELGWDADQVWQVADATRQLLDVWSTANGINEAGTVCGRRANPIPGYWGMAYAITVSGESLDLTILPAMKKTGITYSETYNDDAFSLNNSTPAQIVGQGSRSFTLGNLEDSEKVPLRWDGETSVTDLRTVTEGSPDLYSLYNINDAGWITASTKGVDGMPALPAVLIPD